MKNSLFPWHRAQRCWNYRKQCRHYHNCQLYRHSYCRQYIPGQSVDSAVPDPQAIFRFAFVKNHPRCFDLFHLDSNHLLFDMLRLHKTIWSVPGKNHREFYRALRYTHNVWTWNRPPWPAQLQTRKLTISWSSFLLGKLWFFYPRVYVELKVVIKLEYKKLLKIMTLFKREFELLHNRIKISEWLAK